MDAPKDPLDELSKRFSHPYWKMSLNEAFENYKRMESELALIKTSYKEIMSEPCESDDRVHCTCVPALRANVKQLEAECERLRRACSDLENMTVGDKLVLVQIVRLLGGGATGMDDKQIIDAITDLIKGSKYKELYIHFLIGIISKDEFKKAIIDQQLAEPLELDAALKLAASLESDNG